MGSGIAQVAAVAGHLVKIFDTGLVIEAIAENLALKQEVLKPVLADHFNPETQIRGFLKAFRHTLAYKAAFEEI